MSDVRSGLEGLQTRDVGASALTIVVTARHDNYGGPYERRILEPLRFNGEKLAEFGIHYELIVVEWDPIDGRPLLAELLQRDLPAAMRDALRVIVVAPEYQRALTQNPHAGYLEYIAKNVGIRRAAAPFVLVTNVDVLLGREVLGAVASRRLAAGTIHRAARYDIKLGIDQSGLSWETLEDPRNHDRRPTLRGPLFSGAAGDFLLADRATFHRLRGFNEVYRAARSGIDLNFLVKAYGAGVPIADLGGPVYHLNHVGSMRISKAQHANEGTETPWGNMRWHSRDVAYNNPGNWGLGDAPERVLREGAVWLDFDWGAVPPLVDLRGVTLPARTAGETPGA